MVAGGAAQRLPNLTLFEEVSSCFIKIFQLSTENVPFFTSGTTRNRALKRLVIVGLGFVRMLGIIHFNFLRFL